MCYAVLYTAWNKNVSLRMITKIVQIEVIFSKVIKQLNLEIYSRINFYLKLTRK